MRDTVRYFCISCKKDLTQMERIRFGRGGVCRECYDRLTKEMEDLKKDGG
jgi:hypothetical protein